MKVETFLEKFELLSDTPNALTKLRELVLREAMAGRLTTQDSSEPSGFDLLKEIVEVRERAVRKGLVKDRTEGSMITAGDTISLPESWARCMISEVCDLQTGATPSRQESKYFGGEIPWLVSGDINKGEIVECDGRITKAGLDSSNCKLIPSNSVLMALNGQGKTRATVALLRIDATLNQSLVAMIPYSREGLLPEFIFWNLRGRYYAIRDITGQDQRRGLNMKLVGQLSIPIPPVAEQKRIVAKVDELMALCDRLEAQQAEREARHTPLARAALARFAESPTPANLKYLFHPAYDVAPTDLRASILALAMDGRLVPQNSSEGVRQRVPLGDVVEFLGGYAFESDTFRDHGVRLVRNQNIGHGTLDWTDTEYLPEHLAAEHSKFMLMPGDLVLSLNRPFISTGLKLAWITPRDCPCLLVQRIARVRPEVRRLLPEYLFLWFNAPHFAKGAHIVPSSGVPYIATTRVERMLMDLPPLAEQRRIVAKVNQLMALVDQLEAQRAAAHDTGERLIDAVVAELTA